ncbi:hypothetical protein VTO42DRAFT_1914 [Malbranchea cinnamomea]
MECGPLTQIEFEKRATAATGDEGGNNGTESCSSACRGRPNRSPHSPRGIPSPIPVAVQYSARLDAVKPLVRLQLRVTATGLRRQRKVQLNNGVFLFCHHHLSLRRKRKGRAEDTL